MVQPDSPQDVAIQVRHNEHVKLGRILDHLQETHLCVQESEAHACSLWPGKGQASGGNTYIQAHCVQVHLIKFNIFTVFCNFPAFLQKKPI